METSIEEKVRPDVEYKIPSHFNITDLQKITGCERRKISDILSDAKLEFQPGKQNSKLYDPRRALPLIYSALEVLPKAANDKTKEDLERDENLKLVTAKRKSAELALEEKLRLVIPVSEVADLVSAEYTVVRTQFRSLPSRVVKQVALMTNPEIIHEFLLEKVDQILSEMSTDAKMQLEKVEAEKNKPAAEAVVQAEASPKLEESDSVSTGDVAAED